MTVLDRLVAAGQALSNCAYNAAQETDRPSERVVATLRECYVEWDAARAAFDPPPPVGSEAKRRKDRWRAAHAMTEKPGWSAGIGLAFLQAAPADRARIAAAFPDLFD